MRERLKDERGAIAVLAALTIVILFAAVAFVIDISRLYHERQVLQNAVDFGSLAGAQDLPVQGSAQANIASADALKVATANAPQVTSGNLTITYQCVVGDRNGDGLPDPEDIPFVCGPTGTWSSGWTAKGGRMVHDCNPFAGDKCNTIRLSTSNSIPYYFAPVIGITTGSTGAVNAASCKGACGAASSPVDVVMVLDRTGSMSSTDVANVKNAALSVLDFYEDDQQWIGMVSLPYGTPGSTDKCMAYGDHRTAAQGNPSPPPTFQIYPDATAADWQNAALSKNYKNADGTINLSDPLVQAINCLKRADNWVWSKSDGLPSSGSGNHTNLGDPLDAAREMLANQGRATVPDVIIFMTDGQANQPSTRQPCKYFNDKATIAKTAGQTIFTIGYGIDATNKCPDTVAPFNGKLGSYNLASAATQPTVDNWPGTCNTLENKDGDHYFCTPAASDLEPVFRQVAAAAIETAHLID
ncbi:MAG: TadE/TadG family type IV pilus assembly protein [Thermoanaerobaculia bacterium]